MEIRIDIKDQVTEKLKSFQKEIPFVLKDTINDLLPIIRTSEIDEMKRVFDRPTPYTLNSLFLKAATTSALSGKVGFKDTGGHDTPARKYLGPEIEGGGRNLKRFEKALRAVGALPDGMYIQPGAGARMDSFGNIAPSQIIQILSFFQAFPEMGYKANITAKGKLRLLKGSKKKLGFTYFVGRPGGGRLPLGIYQRFQFARGTAIKPIFIFTKQPNYKPRLNFYRVGQEAIEGNQGTIVNKKISEAIKNAK